MTDETIAPLLVAVALVAVALLAARGMSRAQHNAGALDMPAPPASRLGQATVLAAAARALSEQRGCRVDVTSVKAVSASRGRKGWNYQADVMLADTCTFALTFERLAIELSDDGRVSVQKVAELAPVGAGGEESVPVQAVSGPAPYPLEAVQDGLPYAPAPDLTPSELDFCALKGAPRDPRSQLVNALAEEESALKFL